MIVTNSTFFGNSVTGFGGAGVFLGGGTSLTLRNTILANNSGGNGNCFNEFSTLQDGGGNLSWPDTTCPGINQDPLLDPNGFQNNGGPTKTIALLPGSPAIDAAVAANCPATDQRGVTRVRKVRAATSALMSWRRAGAAWRKSCLRPLL